MNEPRSIAPLDLAAARCRVPLLAGGGLAALGLVLLGVAVAQGAAGWLLVLYIVGVVTGGVWVLLGGVRPAARLRAEVARLLEEVRRGEETLRTSLGQLQGGDVAGAFEGAQALPPALAGTFTTAARALGALVQQIQNSSIEIAAASNAVHQTAAELASDSSEQAAAVVEITATMEELARTAAQIAANASSQVELEARAERSGTAGAAAVEEAVVGVAEVQKRITAIASRADNLGSRSKEIYRVLDLITEIAQETHILALNAAIEAAGAGEHGRRFGVVAEEVRRLAQRSQESVNSVRNLLDEFAGSIRATVVATEEGIKEAGRVLERTRSAEDGIGALRHALTDTARAAREISLATGEQRTASDQVVLTLKEVSQVIQRMAEGLKHFTGTADRLNQLALAIQLLTQSFHLDSPRSLKHLARTWAGEIGARAGRLEALDGQLDELVRRHSFVELAYVVDAQGSMVGFGIQPEWAEIHAVPASVSVGANFSERPWFQSALRDRRPILTPLYDSMLTGDRCFTVAAPVLATGGELVGVLGFDVNVRSWARI